MVKLFEAMDGLKINQSNLSGLNVNGGEVKVLAAMWGCEVRSWPFS